MISQGPTPTRPVDRKKPQRPRPRVLARAPTANRTPTSPKERRKNPPRQTQGAPDVGRTIADPRQSRHSRRGAQHALEQGDTEPSPRDGSRHAAQGAAGHNVPRCPTARPAYDRPSSPSLIPALNRRLLRPPSAPKETRLVNEHGIPATSGGRRSAIKLNRAWAADRPETGIDQVPPKRCWAPSRRPRRTIPSPTPSRITQETRLSTPTPGSRPPSYKGPTTRPTSALNRKAAHILKEFFRKSGVGRPDPGPGAAGRARGHLQRCSPRPADAVETAVPLTTSFRLPPRAAITTAESRRPLLDLWSPGRQCPRVRARNPGQVGRSEECRETQFTAQTFGPFPPPKGFRRLVKPRKPAPRDLGPRPQFSDGP